MIPGEKLAWPILLLGLIRASWKEISAGLAILLACLLLLCSCSTDRWAEVRSDTEWSGFFDDRSVDGYGNQKVDLEADGDSGCVVQKMTEEGQLSVRIGQEGALFWPDSYTDWSTTSAAYGVVTCYWDQ